jgi:hypothetical protein
VEKRRGRKEKGREKEQKKGKGEGGGTREGEFNIHRCPKPLTCVLHCVNSASALCFAVLAFAISVMYEPSFSGGEKNLITASGVEGNFQLGNSLTLEEKL